MAVFLQTVFAFPVAIFTTLLLICVLFWLVGAVGIFDIDGLEVSDGEAVSASGLGGLLLKFKLHEIPFTVLITVVCLLAWICSYVLFRVLQTPTANIGVLYYAFGTANVVASACGRLCFNLHCLKTV